MTAPRSPHARRLRWVALVAFALLTSLYAWWPVLAAYPNTQGGDGPVFHKALEAEHASIARYHELPMWNPYECGGLPLWDNPQGPAGAPLVLLMFVTDTTKTIMAWYVLHSAAGFLCMWILARKDLGLSRPASVLAALAWAYSGFHQQHYAGGHFVFVPFLYMPLALYLWRRAEHDLRAAGGLAILVAWMFHEGAVYPLPHLALLLGAETLMRLWPIKRLKNILRAAAVVGVLAFLLAASRMLPVADQLRAHVRPIGVETDSLQWETLKAMFLDRTHSRGVPGQTYVWPEYGTYFGPLLVVIAIAGMAAGGLETFWLFALMLFCGALMWGHGHRFAPWHMLKGHVFPFKEMRVPSRFRVEVSMFLAAFIGIAADKLPERFAKLPRIGTQRLGKTVRGLVLMIGLVGVGDMLGVGIDWFRVTFYNPPAAKVVPSDHLYLGGPGLAGNMIDQPAQNRGRIACWEEWGWNQGAALWEGDVPQAKPNDDGVVVNQVSRTQNTFTIDVDATRPSTVLVNSTYDKQWRTDAGQLRNLDNLLVVDVPPGHSVVHLRYLPRLFWPGVFLTLLGIAATSALFWYVGRQRRERDRSSSATAQALSDSSATR
ncbi:MAG: hypothetical protein QOI41_5588 [Myxococcales bacterium]|jgi:hypothetical protein|nr:hypothetical protein [Myxococcales bacterium]